MKKILLFCGSFLLIVIVGLLISYFIAKHSAEKITHEYKYSISPLKGQLVLFIDDSFSPCWVFRGEYENALTGVTFDVFVSIFGKIILVPKKL